MTDRGKIVVTGGTGYLGQTLVRRLAARGNEVVVLSRSGGMPPELAEVTGVRVMAWDPMNVDAGDLSSALDGAQAVVHLAGRKAVGERYTKRVKREILESRVKSTETLVTAWRRVRRRAPVFVCASGVGYFGGRSGEHAPLDESAPPGQDFLARVCVEWEESARAAERFGVRVVSTRFGAVLGRGDGPLAVMAKPFKFMVGGPIGAGRQIFSWVHLEDAISALELAIDDARVTGPVNVVAPDAVSSTEVAKAIGRALHKPSWLRAPEFALRLLFGEGAEPLVTGQRAVPAKLEALHFRFRYPTLDEALAEAFA
ncbi:MAG TPA: TIGR01777 family oxidoreductase [Polyangiaceae bacterium]|nr:TIGR01777 family oxidoreductase [Polyangiaceae bacterium]